MASKAAGLEAWLKEHRKDTPLAARRVNAGDIVTTTVTGAAPHHLIADTPIISHRRTRAGDAHAAGRKPTTGVGLGMPQIGAPPVTPVEQGCSR